MKLRKVLEEQPAGIDYLADDPPLLLARGGGAEVVAVEAEAVERCALDQREVVGIGAVEVHRLLQHHRRVGHEAHVRRVVVGRGVQHEGVEDDEVADLARDLDELVALVDQRAEIGARIDAFGMVGEIAGHHARSSPAR